MLTKTQLAAIFHFIGDVLCSVEPTPAESPETASDPNGGAPATTPKRQGRPRKVQDAPATEVAPVTQTTTAAPAEPEPAKPAEPPKGGKTLDELKALIAPLVKAARGGEVKALLNKHAPADYNASESNPYTLSLLSERPEVHEAFVQDIEMLKM